MGLLLGGCLMHLPGSDHLGQVKPKWREEWIMGTRVIGQDLYQAVWKNPHVDKCYACELGYV